MSTRSAPEVGAALRASIDAAEVPVDAPAQLLPLMPVPGETPGARLRAIASRLAPLADPSSDARRLLASALPAPTGFHPAMIETGLALVCERLRPAALETLLAAHPRPTRARARTLVVAAGNIPGIAALEMLIAALSGDVVAVKSSSREPVTAPVLAGLLFGSGPARPAATYSFDRDRTRDLEQLVAWSERVVVFGTDRTIEAFRARVSAEGGRRELLGFGHRLSALWVPRRHLPAEELGWRLATDIALWDQQGCLSPHVVFVARGADVVGLCEATARSLGALGRVLPRGPRTLDERAAMRAWISHFEALAMSPGPTDTKIWRDDEGSFTLVLDGRSPLGPSPLGRSVRFVPVSGVDEMWRHVEGWPLQGLGVGTEPGRVRELTAPLARLGGSRLCVAGRLQEPEASWVGDESRAAGRPPSVDERMTGVWSTLAARAAVPGPDGRSA